MMAINCEGFKLLTRQFLDFKIVRILYLHMLCSDNFIFRCCTATIFSSDVVQLHNNFLTQMCSYTTISSDVVQQQFLPLLCSSNNNFLGCCAAQQISISSAVQQQQQFLQICKIEHL